MHWKINNYKLKFIKTEEDWYPTVNNKVRVKLILLSNKMWRVCVWGGDDFGLEKDFPFTGREAANNLYQQIKDYMPRKAMLNLGMYAV